MSDERGRPTRAARDHENGIVAADGAHDLRQPGAIERKGDSIQRLTHSVRQAESQLQNLVSKAEAEEISRLAKEHYGRPIPHSKISSEMKREFALHATVIAFKTFYIPRSIVHPGQIPSVELLQSQLQLVGSKLAALRERLETLKVP